MASETSGEKKPPFLGSFASILSLLGITLFFSGWIYRWAYFSYFSLDVNAQPYTAQSFLIVPIQIYLGRPSNALQTLLAVLALPVLISLSVRVLNGLQVWITTLCCRLPWIRSLPVRLGLPGSGSEDRQRFIASLLDEAVIVTWVLIAIFLFSKHHGLADARRDALEGSSTLPVVSLVLPQGEGILAQDLRLLEDNGEPIPDPPLANHALIGDLNLARDLRATSLSDGGRQQVWRLLTQEPEGWLYLIRTMPPTAPAKERPMVLAIPNAKPGQALILSPEPPKTSSS
jgi:hypothetical protein